MQIAPKRGAEKGEGPIRAESTAVSQCLLISRSAEMQSEYNIIIFRQKM